MQTSTLNLITRFFVPTHGGITVTKKTSKQTLQFFLFERRNLLLISAKVECRKKSFQTNKMQCFDNYPGIFSLLLPVYHLSLCIYKYFCVLHIGFVESFVVDSVDHLTISTYRFMVLHKIDGYNMFLQYSWV